MSAPEAPKRLADDMIVGASMIAFYLFGSDERRFQRRVYYLTHSAKCRLPSFRLGNQIAVRKSTLARWIADQETSR
jgi:hypothetical protein